MQAQFTGEVGPFLDSVQQRQVSVVVLGSCKYASMGVSASTAEIEQQIQSELLRALRETLGPKMADGQLSFKDLLTGNTSAVIPEIFARSGLAPRGIAVDKLVLHFGVDGHAPAPLAAPTLKSAPIGPQAVNVRVDGLNLRATADGGIDAAGLKNQLVNRAKSTLLWWAFGIGALLFVLLALGGYTYYVFKTGPGSSPPPAAAAARAAHPPKK